jgi:HEAT repeat protein
MYPPGQLSKNKIFGGHMKYAWYVSIILFAVSLGAAETPRNGITTEKWEKAKRAYINLLSSDNPGVKASAANYIRKYDIVEATEALKNILQCENCETVKVSATLALIHISESEGFAAIREALATEENEMLISFYKELLHAVDDDNTLPRAMN